MNLIRILQTLCPMFFIALLPFSVFAQGIQSDQFQSVTLVPRLSGAATIEAALEPRIQLTRKSEALPKIGFGFGAGYSFFLDPHGRRRFRLVLDMGFSGLGDDESLFSAGGTATYSVRGYSQNFAFASVGVLAIARFLNYSKTTESNAGYEVGAGVELAIGSIFYDQPYLFGEFSNAVFVTFNSVNDSIAVFGRVGLRFDWAFRDRSTTEQKWE